MAEQTVVELLAAPAWLTRKYVEQKLREYLQDTQFELQQLTIKPATANGENFASVMTRISVEFVDKNKRQEKTTFILKTTFSDKSPAAYLLEQYGVSKREMNMYEEVLPKLANIIKELGDSRKMFAGTVNVDRERDSIMFEDMSLENYIMADRVKQLDLEHARLVLEKLAEFHAAGAVLNEKQPGIFNRKYDRCFFSSQTRGFKPVMENMLRATVKAIEDDEQLHRRYAFKLNRLIENVMDYGERAIQVREGDFATLCHGDLWTMNMMFNYKDEKPNNVIFIDFQYSVYSSPAIDLHYFFGTSLQDDIFLHHQPELVQFYHRKLVESLTNLKFGGHVPSLFNFQRQFHERGFYAIFASLIFLPAQAHTGPESFTNENELGVSESDDAVRLLLNTTPMMQKKIRGLLPFFDHRGLLDGM